MGSLIGLDVDAFTAGLGSFLDHLFLGLAALFEGLARLFGGVTVTL